MVEGGARVIKSFFAQEFSSSASQGVIDSIVVTVAPTFVGHNGVGYNITFEEVCRMVMHRHLADIYNRIPVSFTLPRICLEAILFLLCLGSTNKNPLVKFLKYE